MNKKSNKALAGLIGILLLMAVPTCYFTATQNNPNDPKNLNEYLGLPVADTGQTLCYDSDGYTIACDENPVGYPRQDGFYLNKPRARSFVGPTAHFIYTSDYTTKDNVTGLIWKMCSEGRSGPDCGTGMATTYTWDNAQTACTYLNTSNAGAGYAGRTTWRLPSIQELKSIIDYGVYFPAIDTMRFPGDGTGDLWSSSVFANGADRGWRIGIYSGTVDYSTKNSPSSVRCVADGP